MEDDLCGHPVIPLSLSSSIPESKTEVSGSQSGVSSSLPHVPTLEVPFLPEGVPRRVSVSTCRRLLYVFISGSWSLPSMRVLRYAERGFHRIFGERGRYRVEFSSDCSRFPEIEFPFLL